MTNGARFGETFRYELGYRLRSASTWLYGGFLLLLAFWVVHVDNTGGHTIQSNAPYRLAETTALFCGLFGMLVTAALFGDAALRDRASRMDPLLFTTRLKPSEFLAGRFLAALVVNAVLLLATPLGLWLATQMPYLQQEAFGSNRLFAYVQPLLLFSLPNLVLVGAILFTIAVVTRQVIAVYFGMIAIFIGYIVAANYWSTIASPVLAALADPLGINALKKMTEYWTASERNVRMIGFPTILVWNRILWLTMAVGLTALLQRTFQFTERFGRGKAEEMVDTGSTAGAAAKHTEEPRNRGTEEPVFGRRTRMLQILAVAREALLDVVSGRAFQFAFVVSIGMVVLWGWNIGATLYDTITWPVTHLVANVVLGDRSILIPWLVIVLFGGELVWKDREAGASEIADAVPVRTSSVILGRFLALVGIIALFQLAFLLGGILLQVLHGYYDFEPLLYVQILGMKFIELVILAAMAMTIHVVINQKYIGHLVVIMTIVFFQSARFHRLLVYNSGGSFEYSEMNGFGPFLTQFFAYKFYWAAWALLLGIVAFLFWSRGPELGLRERVAAARARLTRRVAGVAGIAVALILTFGGFIFYNTNILNPYVPRDRSGAAQAEYERRYGQYRDLPQPAIAAADLRMELYPEQGRADMSGTYRLINKSESAIREVHVALLRTNGYQVRSMSFDRGSKPQLADETYGYRTFSLERPLAPGESLQFKFDVSYQPRGFAHDGPPTRIVNNGTYFDRTLLPFIGYQPIEVTDPEERKRYGLPPARGLPEPDDPDASRHWHTVRDADRIPVEIIVGTPAGQTVVVPSMLRRSWSENGRSYFHYATRRDENFGTAIFSGKYALHKGNWRDVTLEVLHHPGHDKNVRRMVKGMQSALDYYSSVFGPYPYREMRIVEITPYTGINGRAFPSAVAFSESNFITRADDATLDLTFFGTAHEVAHQWWGGQVRPANAKGRSFVSEGVSNYSAMMVTEKVLGRAAARRVYDYQMDRYLTRRGEVGRDVPLLLADSDYPNVSYGKGAVALYSLREQLGADAVNGALRRLIEKFGGSGPPYATSLDLYAELRAATPPSLHSLLTDLFETITLWDLKTQSATTRKLPDGKYEVTLNVHAQKLRADSVGRETPTPMNEVIEVAVFGTDSEKPIYEGRHSIRTGQQTLKINVDGEPSLARLDPLAKLIERDRNDNVAQIEKAQ